ncbi:MAG: KTSC domain-containing protein [Planctomyces sp.]|nr:KTSC domain-containing protein [Planctomyces sp.]
MASLEGSIGTDSIRSLTKIRDFVASGLRPEKIIEALRESRRLNLRLRGVDRTLDDSLRQLRDGLERLSHFAQNRNVFTNVIGVLTGRRGNQDPGLKRVLDSVLNPLETAAATLNDWIDENRRQKKEKSSAPVERLRIINNGRQVEVNRPGFRMRCRVDDPIVTGEMIQATSSNVHSLGFDFNISKPVNSTLFVRYYQRDQRTGIGKVAGPMYAYKPVHPRQFAQMRSAMSKGRFVWDNLRIRGTVAGHQVPYSLVQASQGHIPRRALVIDGMQILNRRRKIGTINGRKVILTSRGHRQTIGPYRNHPNIQNTGNPNILSSIR